MSVLINGNAMIPQITANTARADSKSLILSVLSKEWPLTAKEIYYRIKDQTGDKLTYQGVHKSILLLAGEGVVLKNLSKYSINSAWAQRLRKFGDELENAYLGKRSPHLSDFSQNMSGQLVFNSFSDYFNWLFDEICQGEMPAGDEACTYSFNAHPWPIALISKSQYMKISKFFANGKHYLACKGNSAMDKMLIALWKNLGRKTKLKADCPKNCDIFVYKDYVIQLFYPRSLNLEYSKIFNGHSHANGRIFSNLYSAINLEKEPVNVLVSKNPNLAIQMKTQILEEFE